MTGGGPVDADELFESLRWPDGPVCPHCGAARAHFLRPADGTSRATRTGARSTRRVWKCGACRRQFSVLSGTVFHGSRVGARTWLAGLDVVLRAGTGGTGTPESRLAERCGLDRETARHVLSRLRAALVAAGRRGDGPAEGIGAGAGPD